MKRIHTHILLFLSLLTPLVLNAQQNRIYNGIDLSHYNNVRWDAVLADTNITFCYIKASEGDFFTDSKANYHYLRASLGKLHVGFYHFLRDSQPAQKQYERFKRVLDQNPGFDLLPVIDIERANNDFNDTSKINKALRGFVKAFEADYGYKPMIYYSDPKKIESVISHVEQYRKWIPRWRLSSVSTRVEVYQNFVRRIANVPVDFNYCPCIDRILTPEHRGCWMVDPLYPMPNCQHSHTPNSDLPMYIARVIK